jgi:hypothetical protein
MRIGILSDTHNNLANTEAALDYFRGAGITRLFHCGDITGASIVLRFAGFDVTFVQGNGDYARDEIVTALLMIGGQRVLPARWSGTVAGKRIGVTHGDSQGVLYDLTRGGTHDYVFHGHSHRRRDETIGAARVINPGALGGKHDQSRSVAVVDLAADTVEFVQIAP